MTERIRSASTVGYHSPNPKMESDLSPRKTMMVLVIVVGCFAVLWPRVFYPMLVGSAKQHIKPSSIDKTTGCCDVISETDINTIKIMSELCGTIIKSTEEKPLSGKEIVQRCRQEVLETCGIDMSLVLQEQVRLGQNIKQILNEIRSLNGSLCLKYNYGVAPWRLGVPHRVTTKSASDASNIRQERPLHLGAELMHPAFRERGRAIPQPQVSAPSRPPPRVVVEGRPGPIPGMRPTIGGAGHVVPPSKQGTSSMSIIMPIYTIGIVIFFTYTLMKIIFKKQQPETVGGPLYPPIDPDPLFRKEVFESEASKIAPRLTREHISSKLVVNAMSALLDEVDQEIEARRKSSEVASQDLVNGTLSNGDAVKPQDDDQPTVKVLGMETTASCEGGKKWSRPDSPVLPTPSPPPPPAEPVPPPQEIFLEGALPAQSHLLVSESATEPELSTGEDPAVVLSGKMTLSVISLDSEETTDKEPQENVHIEEIKEVETIEETIVTAIPITEPQQEIQAPLVQIEEPSSQTSGLDKDIEDFLQKLKEQSEFQTPSITLESDDVPPLEVETLEREVDDLIQQAIESIQNQEVTNVETLPNDQRTNETSPNLPKSSLQVLSFLESEREKSPKLDLKPDFSSEIEKLIQEVKDLPAVEHKPLDNGKLEVDEIRIEAEEAPINIEISKESTEENVERDIVNAKLAPDEAVEETIDTVTKSVEEKIKVEEPAEETTDTVTKPLEVEERIKIDQVEVKPKELSKKVEEKPIESDDDELGSDEELVEEIVYEEESGEEEEIEVEVEEEEEEEEEEESEDEIPDARSANRTESSSVQRVNGDRSDDLLESKYTTVSGATAAENDISDEELTDNKEVEEEEEEEIIEVEEEIEDEEYENEVNNVSGESDVEL